MVKNIKGKPPKPSRAAFDPREAGILRETLQKLASSSWKDLKLAPRHGQGVELIPARELKPSVPEQFQDETKFMVFRFHGKLPMAGVRVDDVYHVLWIEPQFGRLYNHG